MPTNIQKREADMQHRIEELEEQLAAAKASTAARQALRDYITKHPALTPSDVALIASEMRAPGRFAKPKGMPPKAAHGVVGKALREARLAKGWSGVATGEKLGVHGSAVSGWERGTCVPTETHHDKLKRVLGVDVAALVRKSANGAAAAEH